MLVPLWQRPVKRSRLRGGWRQRLDEADEVEAGSISRPAAGHLLDWSDGKTSAKRIQYHMANAIADGQSHRMIEALAGIGQAQNAQRGLLKLLEGVGIQDMQTTIESELVSTMVLPSTLIKTLHREYNQKNRQVLGASADKLHEFWTQFPSKPRTKEWATRHPHFSGKSVGDLVTTIPCVLHSDGGPCTKSKSVYCVPWFALLGEGSEQITNFGYTRI